MDGLRRAGCGAWERRGDAPFHLAPAPERASVRAIERRFFAAGDRGGDGEPSGPALPRRRSRAEALDLRRRQPRPRFPRLHRPVRGDAGGRKARLPAKDGRRGAADRFDRAEAGWRRRGMGALLDLRLRREEPCRLRSRPRAPGLSRRHRRQRQRHHGRQGNAGRSGRDLCFRPRLLRLRLLRQARRARLPAGDALQGQHAVKQSARPAASARIDAARRPDRLSAGAAGDEPEEPDAGRRARDRGQDRDRRDPAPDDQRSRRARPGDRRSLQAPLADRAGHPREHCPIKTSI